MSKQHRASQHCSSKESNYMGSEFATMWKLDNPNVLAKLTANKPVKLLDNSPNSGSSTRGLIEYQNLVTTDKDGMEMYTFLATVQMQSVSLTMLRPATPTKSVFLCGPL